MKPTKRNTHKPLGLERAILESAAKAKQQKEMLKAASNYAKKNQP